MATAQYTITNIHWLCDTLYNCINLHDLYLCTLAFILGGGGDVGRFYDVLHSLFYNAFFCLGRGRREKEMQDRKKKREEKKD